MPFVRLIWTEARLRLLLQKVIELILTLSYSIMDCVGHSKLTVLGSLNSLPQSGSLLNVTLGYSMYKFIWGCGARCSIACLTLLAQ